MTRSRSKPVGPLYRELLIEIGCEELPASWLPSLTRQIGQRVGAQLAAARLDCPTPPEPFGTPRRLTVRVAKVADRQGIDCPVLVLPNFIQAGDRHHTTVVRGAALRYDQTFPLGELVEQAQRRRVDPVEGLRHE